MSSNLSEIRLKNKSNYYIGYIVEQNKNITCLISLDKHGNESGLIYLKNEVIGKIFNKSKRLSFYQYLIDHDMSKDLFKLSSRNEVLLKQHFTNLNQILATAFKDNHVISIVTNAAQTYTGRLTQLDNSAIRLHQQNQEFGLEKYAIVIPIDDIDYIKVNFPKTNLFNAWLHYPNEQKNILDLVEIYLDYKDLARFQTPIMARILSQNDHYLLVEKFNDIGQLFAISLINKANIAYICHKSCRINYWNYMIAYNHHYSAIDPYAILSLFKTTMHIRDINNIPSIAKVLTFKKEANNLVNIDTAKSKKSYIARILKVNEDSVTQRNITNYNFKKDQTYKLKDICCLDINNISLIQLQLYLISLHK